MRTLDVLSWILLFIGGLNWLLTAMVVMVLAGEGNVTYILPAGLILGIVQSISTLFVSSSYQQPIALIIFILVLMFRPNGLFARVGR